jgi:hypothetical protein
MAAVFLRASLWFMAIAGAGTASATLVHLGGWPVLHAWAILAPAIVGAARAAAGALRVDGPRASTVPRLGLGIYLTCLASAFAWLTNLWLGWVHFPAVTLTLLALTGLLSGWYFLGRRDLGRAGADAARSAHASSQ